MSKVKLPHRAPSLDMTPMVDLAFLLVTFFILTAKFRADEPVNVTIPSSHSEKILPENVMLVTVDTAGRVFFHIDGKEVRQNLLLKMGQKYNIQFTENDVKRFQVMTSFGTPMNQLLDYIRGDEKTRKKIDATTTGIPLDSTNNQLGDWIAYGWNEKQIFQQTNNIPKENWCRIAIKADGKTDYRIIKRVIQVFQDRNLNSFNLITNMETEQLE
jgi:biopolymer transport protein ExbD